jgi:hypothetical protein
MGLFWPKASIEAKKRRLRGSRTRGGRAGEVNLWDQRGIYALYQDFDLVYVGQAVADRGLGPRLTEHTKKEIAERWDRFSWFGFGLVNKNRTLRAVPAKFHVSRTVVLNHVEGVLVEIAEPRLNGQGGKWRKAVTLYHPIRPPNQEDGADGEAG